MRRVALVVTLAVLVSGLPLLPAAGAVETCTVTWVGPSTGTPSFTAGSSWSIGTVPGPGDTVCFPTGIDVRFSRSGTTTEWAAIDIQPGGRVSWNGGVLRLFATSDLGGLRLENGAAVEVGASPAIAAGEVLAVDGQSATLRPITGTVPAPIVAIDPGGELSRSGGNSFSLLLPVVNRGTLRHDGTGRFTFGGDVVNEGLVTANGDVEFRAASGAGTVTYENREGALTEVTGHAFTPYPGDGLAGQGFAGAIDVVNDGTIRVLAGELILRSGIHRGRVEVAPGARFADAGDTRFLPSSVFAGLDGARGGQYRKHSTGCGSCRPPSHSVVEPGATFLPGEVLLNGGTVEVFDDRAFPTTSSSAGTVIVHDELTLSAGFTSTGGTMTGDGTVMVAAETEFIRTGNPLTISGGLHFTTRATLTQHATISVATGSVFRNEGLWTIARPSGSVGLSGGGRFENAGTAIVDQTGELDVTAVVDNTGSFEVRQGTIDMRTRFVQMDGTGRSDGRVVLTEGRFAMASGTNWMFFPKVAELGGTVELGGSARPNTGCIGSGCAIRHSFNDLSVIRPGAELRLVDAHLLDLHTGLSGDVANGIENRGRLAIAPGALVRGVSYAQTSDAILEPVLGVAGTGRIDVSGAVVLDGGIETTARPGEQIDEGLYRIVDGASLTGAFDTVGGTGADSIAVVYDATDAAADLAIGLPLPTLSVAGPAVPVTEAVGAMVPFTISVTGLVIEPVTLEYETTTTPALAPGTYGPPGRPPATADEDYTPVSGSVVFEPGGATTQVVAVPVLADFVAEAPEELALRVFGVAGAAIDGDGTALGAIADPFAQYPRFGSIPEWATEGTTDVVVPLPVSAGQHVVLAPAGEHGTATVGDDFRVESGLVPALLKVHADEHPEPPETVVVEVRDLSTNGLVSRHAITIFDPSASGPTVTLGDVRASEADGEALVPVTFAVPAPPATSITYRTVSVDGFNPARPGIDYVDATATIEVPTGATTAELSIAVIDDDVFEGLSTRRVGVQVIGGAVADRVAVVEIDDDEPSPTLTIDDLTVHETDTDDVHVFTVRSSLAADFDRCHAVYAVGDGASVPGDVVLPVSGSNRLGNVLIPAFVLHGTGTVTIAGDDLAEGTEVFLLQLRERCTIGNEGDVIGQAVVTIIDDEAAPTVGFAVDEIVVHRRAGSSLLFSVFPTIEVPSSSSRTIIMEPVPEMSTALQEPAVAFTSGHLVRSFPAGSTGPAQDSWFVQLFGDLDRIVDPDRTVVVRFRLVEDGEDVAVDTLTIRIRDVGTTPNITEWVDGTDPGHHDWAIELHNPAPTTESFDGFELLVWGESNPFPGHRVALPGQPLPAGANHVVADAAAPDGYIDRADQTVDLPPHSVRHAAVLAPHPDRRVTRPLSDQELVVDALGHRDGLPLGVDFAEEGIHGPTAATASDMTLRRIDRRAHAGLVTTPFPQRLSAWSPIAPDALDGLGDVEPRVAALHLGARNGDPTISENPERDRGEPIAVYSDVLVEEPVTATVVFDATRSTTTGPDDPGAPDVAIVGPPLTIAAGQRFTCCATLMVLADGVVEPDETVEVRLDAVTNARAVDGALARALVLDADSSPVFTEVVDLPGGGWAAELANLTTASVALDRFALSTESSTRVPLGSTAPVLAPDETVVVVGSSSPRALRDVADIVIDAIEPDPLWVGLVHASGLQDQFVLDAFAKPATPPPLRDHTWRRICAPCRSTHLATNPFEPFDPFSQWRSVDAGEVRGLGTLDDLEVPAFAALSSPITVTSSSLPAPIAYDTPVATARAATVSVACDPPPGTLLGLGDHTVACTATDGYGNSTTTSVVLRVEAGESLVTQDSVQRGAWISVRGVGFAAGSNAIVELRSDPVLLAAAAADDDGIIALDVAIPLDVPLGGHQIVIRGTGDDDRLRTMQSPLLVIGSELPAITIDDAAAAEAEGSARVPVRLDAATDRPVSVRYTMRAGTARAGVDFTRTTGTVSFAPGTTSASIDVSIVADGIREPDEQFTVELWAPVDATLERAIATVTIYNSDPVFAMFDPAASGPAFVNAYLLGLVSHYVYRGAEGHPGDDAAWQLAFREHFGGLGLEDITAFSEASLDTEGVVGSTPNGATIVGFRGTEPDGLEDFLADALTDASAGLRSVATAAGVVQVHEGFWEALDLVYPTIRSAVADRGNVPVWLTGHSLGGALATLAAFRLQVDGFTVAGVHTFGAPNVGGPSLRSAFEALALNARTQRWVNDRDPIAMLLDWNPLYAEVGIANVFTTRANGSVALTLAGADPSGLVDLADHATPRYALRVFGRINATNRALLEGPPPQEAPLIDVDVYPDYAQWLLDARFSPLQVGGSLQLLGIGAHAALDLLVAAGADVEFLAEMLRVSFQVSATIAALLLQSIAPDLRALALILRDLWALTAPSLAKVFVTLGTAFADIASVIVDVYDVTALTLAQALKVAGASAVDIAAALDGLLGAPPGEIFIVLREIGISVNNAGRALRDALGLDPSTMILSLKSAHVALADIVRVLRDSFALTYSEIASLLRSVGSYSAEHVAIALREAASQSLRNIATALRAAGYAVDVVADALVDALAATRSQLADALWWAGYRADEALAGLRAAFTWTEVQLAETLHAARYSVVDVTAAMRVAFGWSATRAVQVLGDAGIVARAIATALDEVFARTASQVAVLLRTHFDLETLADAIRMAFGLTDVGLAAALRDAGFSPLELVRAVRGEFNRSATRITAILWGLNVGATAITDAIREVFGSSAVSIATMLKQAGASATQTARALVNSFGIAIDAVAAALKGAGYTLNAVVAALVDVFDASLSLLVAVLTQLGFTVTAITRAFCAYTGCPA